MWSDINADKPNIGMAFYTFPPETTNTFRLLGAFQVCERLYVKPDGNVPVSKKELHSIFKGDTKVYDEVNKRIEDYHNRMGVNNTNGIDGRRRNRTLDTIRQEIDGLSRLPYNANHINTNVNFGVQRDISDSLPREFNEFTKEQKLKYINDLYHDEMKWQKVLLINALSDRDSNPKVHIICLSHKIMSSIKIAMGRKEAPISGLYAHDISIRKRGAGMQSQYECSASQQASHLTNETIRYLLRQRLWDIPSILKKINDGGPTSYLYRKISDYKMPSEFNDTIFSHYDENEGQHFEQVKNHINDLPENAIENRSMRGNPIATIEI